MTEDPRDHNESLPASAEEEPSPSTSSATSHATLVSSPPQIDTMPKSPSTPYPPLKTAVSTVPSLTPPYSIYTPRQIWGIVLLVSLAGMFSPMTANIFFPVIPTLASDLHVSVESINLSITWYMLGQGASPTIWGSLGDVLGRRPVYIACFILYIGASLALSFINSYPLLVVFRVLQSCGSASVIAIGSGTIGDLAPPSRRGGFMGAFGLGPMLGPPLAPVIGGLLAQRFGWHSLFMFLSAFAGVVLILMIFVLPETLRSLVGNGSIPARGINRSLVSYLRERYHKEEELDEDVVMEPIPSMPPRKTWKDLRPLVPFLMFREKDVLLVLTFNAVIYTLFYCVLTSMSSSFKATYGLTTNQTGLCFLANGCGCLVASVINGPRMNHDYQVVKKQLAAKKAESGETEEKAERPKRKDQNDLSAFPIEHARMRSMPPFFFVFIGSCIAYGWTLDKGVHLSVPLIFQFFIGLTVTTQFNCASTLMVDLFPTQSASVTASNNLYRCFCGAAGTAFVDPVINALGPGWAFTMLSLITCLFAPLMVVEWKYGFKIRAERAERLKLHKEEKQRAKDNATEHS